MGVPVIVQHHPARRRLLDGLLQRLDTDAVQVIADPQPDSLFRSAWRSYRACLEAFPDDASHVLVIQDDTTCCGDLVAALPAVVEAAQRFTGDDPLIALSLFHEVTDEQRAYLELAWRTRTRSPQFLRPDPSWQPYIPLVATIWPRAARDALLAVAPHPYTGHGTLPDATNPPLVRREGDTWVFIGADDNELTGELGRLDMYDDTVVYRYRELLPPVVGTLPALVCHLDGEVSVLEPRSLRDRRTVMYGGDDFSALEVFSELRATHATDYASTSSR